MVKIWYVYMVECVDKSLYTGITTDYKRREEEHNNSKKGAKYTKSRRPVNLVYIEESMNRSTASKREYEIKKLTRTEKLKLITHQRIKYE